ncbi:MAG: alpha-amylase family glycosyl hydrolase [Planctomycetota bacterium]
MSISSSALPSNPLMYEINTRVWLRELSMRLHQPVQLDTVPDTELDRIAELGFHAVWLMGVWTTGPESLLIARTRSELQHEYHETLHDFSADDCIGSPYAVASYVVSPKLGGNAALARLRERMARKGLNLILDFVCNHTGRDHWMLETQPDVFVQGTEADFAAHPDAFFKTPQGKIIAFGRDPFFAPWTDTAQINYGQSAGRTAMLNKLMLLAEQCDGVRCDMAMLILPEIFKKTWGDLRGPNPIDRNFWVEAIEAVTAQHPHFIFLAESYWDKEAQLQSNGFHFTYDKILYDRLLKNDFWGVAQHLRGAISYQKKCARFVENHDEARAAQAFGSTRSISAAAVTLFTPGMRFIHEGQLEGRCVKVPVQLGRRPNELENAEIELAYEHMLCSLRDPIFQSGHFAVIEAYAAGHGDRSNESLIALQWTPNTCHTTSPRSRKVGYLIVVNLSGGRAYGRVPLSRDLVSEGKQYIFDDRFNGKRYDRDGGELLYPGLYIALEAFQPHVFEISDKV